MRLAKLIPLVSTVGLLACGGSEIDPTPADKTTTPETTESETVRKTGTVSWNLESTDCPRDEEALWGEGQIADMELTGDSVVLHFQTMPELHGVVQNGRADLSGVTTFFWGGEDVTCSVVGHTELGQTAISGQVSETLTSQSALNCVSTGSFTVDFEP